MIAISLEVGQPVAAATYETAVTRRPFFCFKKLLVLLPPVRRVASMTTLPPLPFPFRPPRPLTHPRPHPAAAIQVQVPTYSITEF